MRVYSAKSDVYSFGVVMWEVYADGATPYAELAAAEVVAAVRGGHRLPSPGHGVDEGVLSLIRRCTGVAEVGARPSMAEAVRALLEICGLEAAAPPPLHASNNHLRLAWDADEEDNDESESAL